MGWAIRNAVNGKIIEMFFVASFQAAFSFGDPASAATPIVVPLQSAQAYVWDDTRSRLWVADGKTINIVNGDTGAIEETFSVNDAPFRIAVSGDGAYLYSALSSRAAVQRFSLATRTMDFEITLGARVTAIASLPNNPNSIV